MSMRLIVGLVAIAVISSTPLAADPLGSEFTYQGRLMQGGEPFSGTADLTFSLWRHPTSTDPGDQVGGDQVAMDQAVTDGLFTAVLNAAGEFGATAFDGEQRWLQVVVEGTTLAPRQLVTATPYALKTRGVDGHSLDSADGSVVDALFVRDDGTVGIGTNLPVVSLDVFGGIRARGGPPGGFGLKNNGYAFDGFFGDDDSGMFSSFDGQLEFYTDSVERMRMTPFGDVGIGTESPRGTLDVVGRDGVDDSNKLDANGISVFLSGGNGGGGDFVPGGAGGSIILKPGSGGTGFGPGAPGAVLITNEGEFNALLRIDSGLDNPQGSVIDFQDRGTTEWAIVKNIDNDFFIEEANIGPRIFIEEGTGNVGLGTVTPSERLHVDGNICATGSIASCSDARFKTNIAPLTDALDLVERLQPVRFDWRRDEFADHRFSDERQIGFIAQQIEAVFPELVQRGSDGYLSVDYGRLTPVLVEALHELQATYDQQLAQKERQINAQQKELADLTARIERLERMQELSTPQ